MPVLPAYSVVTGPWVDPSLFSRSGRTFAAVDYGDDQAVFHESIDIVPSAIAELAHWQQQGYALIAPNIMDKQFAMEEIR